MILQRKSLFLSCSLSFILPLFSMTTNSPPRQIKARVVLFSSSFLSDNTSPSHRSHSLSVSPWQAGSDHRVSTTSSDVRIKACYSSDTRADPNVSLTSPSNPFLFYFINHAVLLISTLYYTAYYWPLGGSCNLNTSR